MAEPVRVAAVVPWDKCVDFAARAYEACGLPPDQARDAAVSIVDADGHGTTTHGLKNLKQYIVALKEGRTNPRPNIRQVSGGKAVAVLSGDNAQGHVAAFAGMRKAIELAKEYGTGTVMVRDSNHYGHSAFWAMQPIRHNMVGFSFTNALSTMAAWGGKEALVGNNPPSWAVPSRVADESNPLPIGDLDPVFLDMALSVVAGNRLDIYARRGEPIPLGWALDSDGNPTTDARARANGGTFAPIADYKGSGLAVMLSLICSFLSGGLFDDQRWSDEAKTVAMSGTCSHWFQAFDVKQFTDLEAFTRNVRETRERIRATPPKAGVAQVFAPGDIENDKARRFHKEGIPLEQFTLDDLAWVAEHVGVQYDLV
ncbi:MAG: Ldh family oxidoreductase [Chloroflexi bacterium]|nr:Ldh family oxidoreductase [Chloroflexota bacterium]